MHRVFRASTFTVFPIVCSSFGNDIGNNVRTNLNGNSNGSINSLSGHFFLKSFSCRWKKSVPYPSLSNHIHMTTSVLLLNPKSFLNITIIGCGKMGDRVFIV